MKYRSYSNIWVHYFEQCAPEYRGFLKSFVIFEVLGHKMAPWLIAPYLNHTSTHNIKRIDTIDAIETKFDLILIRSE